MAGDVAVVTGAASGINREISLTLARHGAIVACADVDDAGLAETVGLLTAEGGKGFAVHMDVGNSDQLRAQTKSISGRCSTSDTVSPRSTSSTI